LYSFHLIVSQNEQVLTHRAPLKAARGTFTFTVFVVPGASLSNTFLRPAPGIGNWKGVEMRHNGRFSITITCCKL
jgi:hypothetical protein